MAQVPESQLQDVLRKLLNSTSKNDEVKKTAVRWFNRLYYDVRHWNETFISFLRTYPGFKDSSNPKDYEDFQEKLEEYTDSLQMRYGTVKNDLCTNLKILSARFTKDFDWLFKTDKRSFREIREMIDESYATESAIIGIAHSICDFIYDIRDNGNWHQKHHDEIKKRIEEYEEESKEAINRLHELSNSVGINLLSVDEYEQAIKEEGSLNPNIMVIGEITNHKHMESYNMHGGNVGAFGSNASAQNFTQNIIENFKEIDLQKLSEELIILKKKLKEEAQGKDEYDAPIGAIANAQEASKKGNGQEVMAFLKSAGKWALDTATKIGTDVAAKAINYSLGLQH